MKQKGILFAIALVAAATGTTADANDSATGHRALTAGARIYSCDPDGRLLGFARLIEKPSDQGIKEVTVAMLMTGLSEGAHGVHIHEKASCDPCSSAGGHFDPGPNSNSSPDGNHPFHMGDLVNIQASRWGVGFLKAITTRVTLSEGPLSVFDENGSAFIIHVDEDTFCPDGVVTGCAGGGRTACGIIQLE